MSELELATQTSAGAEALRWFLQQPDHLNYLRLAAEHFTSYQDTTLKRVLLSSLCKVRSNRNIEDSDWILETMHCSLEDENLLVRVEAVKLMAILVSIESQEYKLVDFITVDEEMIIGLLMIEEEYPLQKDSLGEIVLIAFQEIYTYHSEKSSEVTNTFINLLEHPSETIRKGASKALGHTSPDLFLEVFCKKIQAGHLTQLDKDSNIGGFILAVNMLLTEYYGSADDYCPSSPGLIEEFDKNQRQQAFEDMCPIALPVIKFYWPHDSSKLLMELLVDLCPQHYPPPLLYSDLLNRNYNPPLSLSEREAVLKRLHAGEALLEAVSFTLSFRYQLRLPFDDLDEGTNGKKP
jgi:hypothetical protein